MSSDEGSDSGSGGSKLSPEILQSLTEAREEVCGPDGWFGSDEPCPVVPEPPAPPAPGAPLPPQPQPQVPAVLVSQLAMDQLEVVMPGYGTSPPKGAPGLVSMPMWLYIDRDEWRSHSASATAGSVTATVTAEPTEVTWNMGNGDSVTCAGPGHPYDGSTEPPCGYTYDERGEYSLTVTVAYDVTWTSNTGASGTQDAFSLTDTFSLQIQESQATIE